MDLCNESFSSGQPAVFGDKNANIRYCTQSWQPILSIPAMLIGAIDVFPLIPLSLTVTLAGSHKHNPLASFSSTFF